jgi:hypothetical protein
MIYTICRNNKTPAFDKLRLKIEINCLEAWASSGIFHGGQKIRGRGKDHKITQNSLKCTVGI